MERQSINFTTDDARERTEEKIFHCAEGAARCAASGVEGALRRLKGEAPGGARREGGAGGAPWGAGGNIKGGAGGKQPPAFPLGGGGGREWSGLLKPGAADAGVVSRVWSLAKQIAERIKKAPCETRSRRSAWSKTNKRGLGGILCSRFFPPK